MSAVQRHLSMIRRWCELALAFAALILIDRLYFDGAAFAGLEPNPFWLPVLAFSLAYGTGLGLAAASIASLLWIFAAHDWPSNTDHLWRQLHLSILPLLWIASALVAGEVTASRQAHLKKLRAELEALAGHADKISMAFERLSRINRGLQVRIVTEHHRAGEALQAAAGLLTSSRADRLAALADLIRLSLNSADFTCYHVRGMQLLPVLSGPAASPAPGAIADAAWAEEILRSGEILHQGQAHAPVLLGGAGIAAIPVRDEANGTVLAILVIHSAEGIRLTSAKLAEFAQLGHSLARFAELLAPPRAIRLVEEPEDEARVA